MQRPLKPVRIVVPCSTSNLGPGFDCLGCAFRLYNEFIVRVLDGEGENEITFSGPEGEGLRPNPNNLFFRAAGQFYRRINKPMPRFSVHSIVNVPNARGLGSSSTAVVAGLMAANHFSRMNYPREQLLRLAIETEGHPDNATPAILGGLTAGLIAQNPFRIITNRWVPHNSYAFVFFLPTYTVSTKRARHLMPKEVLLTDAVANTSRMPLLIEALIMGKGEWLDALTEDHLVLPHRMKLYAHFGKMRQVAMKAGAHCVTVSGAGPTMLAICDRNKSSAVIKVWKKRLKELGMIGRVENLEVDTRGAVVMPLENEEG